MFDRDAAVSQRLSDRLEDGLIQIRDMKRGHIRIIMKGVFIGLIPIFKTGDLTTRHPCEWLWWVQR